MDKKSASGWEPNKAAALCYSLGWVTGIIFLILDNDNDFIKFHALQSILIFGSITLLGVAAYMVKSLLVLLAVLLGISVSFLVTSFGFFSLFIWVASLLPWAFLMIKAYRYQTYKSPFFGVIAENYM